MRRSFLLLLFLALWVLSPNASGASEALEKYRAQGVTIVHAEQAEPHYFKGRDGEARGLLVDFWKLWSQKTGIPVRFVMAPWHETLVQVVEGKADIHAGLVKLDERLDTFEFSEGLYLIKASLLVLGSEKAAAQKIYSEYTIGAVAGAHTEAILHEQHPGANVRPYATPQMVMKALIDREINAVSMDMPTFYFNNAKLDEPLEVTASDTLFINELHGAVAKGNTELLILINDGFAKMDAAEKDMILNRWMVSPKEETSWQATAIWISVGALMIGCAAFFILTGPFRKDPDTQDS